MNRKDIKIENTWDLTKIYKDESAFTADLTKANQLTDELITYQDRLTTTSDNLYTFLKTNDHTERLIAKIYTYCHLTVDVEPNNQAAQTRLAQTMNLLQKAKTSLSFVDNELLEHDNKIKEYLQEERFKVYEYKLKQLLKTKEHILDKETELLLSKVDNISDLASDVFDSLRLEYEDVLVDGKKEFLNSATLTKFLKNADENVRKQAYHNFFKEYKKYENVFANTLAGVMKKDAFYADVRRFPSSLAASVFNDDVPVDLFFKILDMANTKYRHLFHRYNRLKKKLLNKDKLYNYDLSVPLVKSLDKKYTIEESFDLIFKAVEPFGQEYKEIIQKAKDERWIDYYPHLGKRSGAYSSGSYDTNPYILTNFIGDYNSVTTLIHELGHSAHSYLSNHNQEFVNSHYRIFVAEVASTVNETLLINHMMTKASPEDKKYFIYEQLENCVGFIFRQPMFANFEYKLHTMAENNEPLSSKVITDLYTKLNQEYFGPDVILDDLTGYSCYYVPHFYYNYYVYKYTLGMTVALAIVNRILKGDPDQVKSYLNFLKSGGSKSPVDLLREAGVDPLSDEIYNDAFNYFANLLDQFEELVN